MAEFDNKVALATLTSSSPTPVDTNLRGAYLTLHYAVPHMKKAGGGATAYACIKAGLLTMGGMLALELAKHRIRVN